MKLRFPSNEVERDALEDGDHIYSYRVRGAYSHHGIFIGDNKVMHFSSNDEKSASTSFASSGISSQSSTTCTAFADCGFRQPKSGVIISCLDCFLKGGTLYRYRYGVNKVVFCSGLRGGSCTTAKSDEPYKAIERAIYLHDFGFGNYNLFKNNCEDFAVYCKTELLIVGEGGSSRSGQISSIFCAVPLLAFTSRTVRSRIPAPVAITMSAVMYSYTRLSVDIGVRKDVEKVHVEDLARRFGWMNDSNVWQWMPPDAPLNLTGAVEKSWIYCRWPRVQPEDKGEGTGEQV